MNILHFKRVRVQFMVWFLLVTVIPLLILGTVMYQQRSKWIKQEAFNKLIAIRNLKVERLENWLAEREGDIRIMAADDEIRAVAKTFDPMIGEAERTLLRDNARAFLQRYIVYFQTFSEIFIIHPESGKIALSTEPSHEGLDRSQDPHFTEPLRLKDLYIKDIYYSTIDQKPTMAFAMPVFSLSDNRQIAGVLVAKVDLQNTLYKLLLNRIGMGTTGETLIVNRDVVALNELRWHSNAPLNLKIIAEPPVNAASGKTGIAETTDYRGEPILAAYTYLPKTQWGLVAKQDLQELYQPINALLRQVLLFFGIAIGGVMMVAFLVAKGIADPIVAISHAAQQFAEGDFTRRYQSGRQDEIGELATAFNAMADALASWITIQQGNLEFSNLLIATDALEEFRRTLTTALIKKTNSQVGVYYHLDQAEKVFKPVFSIGASPELLRPFSASDYEGELGHALIDKQIAHLTNIPETTPFVFKTTSGAAIPEAMLTIPVVIEQEVQAVISLASLTGYTKEHLEIVGQNWISLNTKFATLYAAETVKALLAEMHQKNQELEHQTQELQYQAELLRKQNVELAMQTRQVEEANRLKSEFLSNMSHELRTPLNSVIALSKVLIMQARPKLSEEESNYLEIISRNGKHLLNLINDILDISKIETGKVEVLPKSFAIRATIEAVKESLEPLAEEKGIDLLVKIPADIPMLTSDEAKVRQILQNVIGNAVKFTEQGSIEIHTRYDTENVCIAVKDTGIGIPQQDLPHIFEEFRQVDGSASRNYEGTGLGLTIALRNATLLGGKILAESMLGAGSTFTIILPLNVSERKEHRAPSEPERFPQAVSAKKPVLVVDDDPRVVAMISAYLTEAGYHVLTATSGKHVIELARRAHPFAITLDIIMPEMDGWETLQTLKQDPATADIPVIIVSVANDRDTAFALGAVGYVTKPVSKAQLIEAIYDVGGLAPATVMIVDDNPIDRQQEARIIDEEGIRAIVAESGQACLDLLQHTRPDVLILDLMMPGMDGFAVLNRIRSNAAMRDLPVIVVTAKDLTLEERQRLHGDAAAILAKSETTPQELLRHLKTLLHKLEIGAKSIPLELASPTTRLLLVEDSEPAIIQIQHVLTRQNYQIDIAHSGQEAIDYVQEQIPDGIILDLMMPGMNGFEVLDRIRGTEATAAIPVLILTAKDLTPEDLKRLSANHVQQLIQKGNVDSDQLLFKIQLMLGSAPKPAPGYQYPGLKLKQAEARSQEALISRSQDASASLSFEPGALTPSQPVILVIEDNPDNMTTIKAICPSQYQVIEAEDGAEGVQKAIALLPDLIVLDMSLPKMDGYEVIAHLRANAETRTIPVIALTAHVMKGDRGKILNAGSDDYISKPVDPEELLTTIENWMKNATKTKK